jgi:DNA polymerase/3'-5' exonuclease PolX
MPMSMVGLLRRLRQHSNDADFAIYAEKSGNIRDTPRVVATKAG